MTDPIKALWNKREDEEEEARRGGVVIELDPIDIVGDPNARPIRGDIADIPMDDPVDDEEFGGGLVTVLDPIEIEGDPNALPMNDPSLDRRKAFDGTTPTMDLPEFVTEVTGQPVVDARTGLGGYEFPEWAASEIANDDGSMPESVLGALGNVALGTPERIVRMNPVASSLLFGDEEEPEIAASDRTILAAPAAAGLADAGSFGLADDVAGGLAGLVSDDDTGISVRDQMRGGLDWSRREAPGSTSAGEAVGMGAQMAVPSAAFGRGLSPVVQGLASGAEGAAFAGLTAFGNSDADTVGERLQDAALPAVLGGTLGGGLGYASGRLAARATEPVDAGELERLRRERALQIASQAGGAQSLSSKRMRTLVPGRNAEERIQSAVRLADQLEEMGALEPRRLGPFQLPPSADVIASRVDESMSAASDDIGSTLARMAQEDVSADDILEYANTRVRELASIPGAEAQAAQMRGWRDRFQAEMQRGMSMDRLQQWKTHWRQTTNFDSPQQVERQGVYGAISDSMQGNVDRIDPEMGSRYRSARERYHIGKRFREANADRELQEARNRQVSLSDYLTGLEGFRQGGILGGVGSVLMNKGVRRNEHGVQAMRLERAAQLVEEAPQRFGRWAQRLQAAASRGPRAFAAALYVAQQSDPQVRAAVMEDETEQQAAPDEAMQEAPMLPEDAPIEDFLAPIPPEDAPIEDFL